MSDAASAIFLLYSPAADVREFECANVTDAGSVVALVIQRTGLMAY